MQSRKTTGCLVVLITFLGLYGLIAVGFQKALMLRGRHGRFARGGPVWAEGAPAVWQGVSVLSLCGGIIAYDLLYLAGRKRAANWAGVGAVAVFFGSQWISWDLYRDERDEIREQKTQEDKERWLNSPEVKEMREATERMRKWIEEEKRKREEGKRD